MKSDILNNRWISFAETSMGYSHVKEETECEDSSGCYTDKQMHICVVADGHGSKQYFRTKKGSSFAVDVTITNIKMFVENIEKKELFEKPDEHFIELAKNIVQSWNKKILMDYLANPFSEEELSGVPEKYRIKYIDEMNINHAYGTTLIAFVVTKDYSFGVQLGDGKCVILDNNNEYLQPIPWDDNCQMNVTTSMCDKNALQEFRFYFSDKLPIAAFCGTDGVDDSYTGDDDLTAFYNGVLSIFSQYGYETGINEIKEYLPILSKKGSMDDVSVSGIIDMKRVRAYFNQDEEISEKNVGNLVSKEDTSDECVLSEVKSDEVIGIIDSAECNNYNETDKNIMFKDNVKQKNSRYLKYAIGLTVCLGFGILIRLIKRNKR